MCLKKIKIQKLKESIIVLFLQVQNVSFGVLLCVVEISILYLSAA